MGTPLPSGGHGSLFVLLGLNPGRLHEANGTAISPLPRHSLRVLRSASLRPAYCQYRLRLVQPPLLGTEISLSQTSGFDSLMTGKLRTLLRDAGREGGRDAARVGVGLTMAENRRAGRGGARGGVRREERRGSRVTEAEGRGARATESTTRVRGGAGRGSEGAWQ